ncbi:hypothetical protein AB0K60_16505 [Thermopolyspora sp. NPDC052614]|uniref:5'-methylthioadenosine/S-adenosylhomocysteine nucleosidase family protein n=1 Tax=Thermopolyspora sp. NPDC052614 TaxID=3155682 RepID=UPI003444AA0D
MNGNSGIANHGGTVNVSQSAVGPGATVNVGYQGQARTDDPGKEPGRTGHADVGVITILSEEARAVREVLDLHRVHAGTLTFFEGTVEEGGVTTRVASFQALSMGQRSPVVAFDYLRRHYNPSIIALTGIGGGIGTDIAIGDVVITTRVVYYDLRKETPRGRLRRGEERESPAMVGHAVNSFFTDHGEPSAFRALDGHSAAHDFRVHRGLIGSGDAVIADAKSEIVRYLKAYNEKTLGVEMEAGGLTQAFHEQDGPHQVRGWVVVRGISDDASQNKGYDHHDLAARHAATILRALLPYLPIPRS